MPQSALLRNEIKLINTGTSDAHVDFYNGSTIKVVTASDTARGNRANILLIDEFRMVAKTIIDTILKKFLTAPRMPGYLSNPKYKHLKERNKEIYLSSAYFKDHWAYTKVEDYAKKMLKDDLKYFVCGLPYQLSILEGLLDPEAVAAEMSETGFNEITFSMEMEALWFGDSDGTFFSFDVISKNRKIAYGMLPDDLVAKITGDTKKIRIQPKQNGEKRLLAVDLALMASGKNKNDASALFVLQLLPSKANRYTCNAIYTESSEGVHTADQAYRIRKLFDMYSCDYIVIDGNGVGFGVVDTLVRDITDPETGEIYPALSSCNNVDWAARCTSPTAEKVIWVINATDRFNSECAVLLREGFRSGKVRLLVSEYDGEANLISVKGYNNLDLMDKQRLQLVYINTTLLINELINLRHEESGGQIKLIRNRSVRKDRYSSISYGYWVACQLEQKLSKNTNDSDFLTDKKQFLFRAPRTKKREAVR